MTGIKDFKGYLNDRTEGKLSVQEIDAIASQVVTVDGEKMTLEKAVEECLDPFQSPRIFVYDREDGKKGFLRHACLSMIFKLTKADEGVAPLVELKEVGYWVVGEGRFGSDVWTGGNSSLTKNGYLTEQSEFNDTVNNAIVVDSTWLDGEWGLEGKWGGLSKIVIYLAG